jgi:DNA-binding response OmpR family regulator
MALILVVDDEVEVAEAIRRVLEKAGFSVVVANGVTAGVQAAEMQQPDIVITDIIMPKSSGIELIKTLRDRHPRVRVIAISGGGSFGLRSYKPDALTTHAYLAAARTAGTDEVLTKPFDMDDLLAAIRRQLLN